MVGVINLRTPMPTKKKRIPVMFDDDLWEYVEERAALEGRSLSNMVAGIVREAYNRDTGKKLGDKFRGKIERLERQDEENIE